MTIKRRRLRSLASVGLITIWYLTFDICIFITFCANLIKFDNYIACIFNDKSIIMKGINYLSIDYTEYIEIKYKLILNEL